MARTATPTSAKTASHMLAIPRMLRSSTANFTARAKMMFCRATAMVFREMRMALGRLRQIVLQQDQICRLHRRIRTDAAHGNPNTGHSQNRRIVHAVTHKDQGILGLLKFPDLFHLILRQEPGKANG